jgi:hypothetical protein
MCPKAFVVTQVQDAISRHPERFKHVRAEMNLAAFQRAASWVSSRAFYVDGYHGVCTAALNVPA